MKSITPAAALPSFEAPLHAFGSNLRKARQARGWTMAEAAERIMVSLNTYKRMESGDPKVAFGSWAMAWQRMELLGAVLKATAPENDKIGQAWRDVHAVKRVRKSLKQGDNYDF